MHSLTLSGASIVVALIALVFVSPITATLAAQGPSTPTAPPAPQTAPPASAPAPTLTSNDVPPGYDEVYLSLADVLMGPIHGQMVWESFLRREPAPGPQLVLSVGMTAPEFAFIASQPSAQRPMHDAAADGFFRAADNFAGLHRNLAAGTSQGVETLRSAREAVEPPRLEAGTWMTMDTYRYQRGAEEGDGAIAMLGRGPIISVLVVESTDGGAADAVRQYAHTVEGRLLRATEPSQ